MISESENRKYKYGKEVIKGFSESSPSTCSCVCYAAKLHHFQAMSTALSLSIIKDHKTQLLVTSFPRQLGRWLTFLEQQKSFQSNFLSSLVLMQNITASSYHYFHGKQWLLFAASRDNTIIMQNHIPCSGNWDFNIIVLPFSNELTRCFDRSVNYTIDRTAIKLTWSQFTIDQYQVTYFRQLPIT